MRYLMHFSATSEPGDNPEVVRAKYYIRDEFLVSKYAPMFSQCFNKCCICRNFIMIMIVKIKMISKCNFIALSC